MTLPREAHDGLMRVWLELLREKHPGVSWVSVEQGSGQSTTAGTVFPAVGEVAGQDELATAV